MKELPEAAGRLADCILLTAFDCLQPWSWDPGMTKRGSKVTRGTSFLSPKAQRP